MYVLKMRDIYLPILLALLLPNFVFLTPVPQDSGTDAFIITTTEISNNNDSVQQTTTSVPDVLMPPELKSMHVDCNLTNRYAHTVVSSRYKNPANVAQETTFSIILPDTAFISGFSMKIKGKTYNAYIKEKAEAKREYDQAIQSGLGAGYVEQNVRDSNKFTVSVNVEPLSKVTFNLNYEELLVRKHGKYEMVINLHPGQLVKDLTVDINVNETQKLVNLKTPALRTGNEIVDDKENNINEYATITQIGEDGKAAHIHFAPSISQQKKISKILAASKNNDKQNEYNPYYNGNTNSANETESLSGQFVIEYDVERNAKGGEILVNNGYFVHFFAPPELKPLPKHAVFVLDVSGSMSGRKIEQLKHAMNVILEELKPNDYFNLVEFSFGAKVWDFDNTASSPTFEESRKSWWYNPEEVTTPKVPFVLPPAFRATPENKQKAKEIIKNMEAGGGTNIYDALRVALNLTTSGIPENENVTIIPQPIVIFLTDGDATDGETDTKIILNTVDELNEDGKTAVFSLAFGYDANKDILKKLSLKNSGFMRQIYEASDAALQLQDFYKQISSPLLTNVTFKYPEGEVDSVTQNHFHTLFDGGEFVVSGKMENLKDKILYVHGLSVDGPIDFSPVNIPIPDRIDVPQTVGPLERLWAYMTIKQLLDKNDELSDGDDNSTDVDDLKKQALKLALKYSFVTPVTSLVVVKPNETEKAINTEEARQQEGRFFGVQALSLPQSSYGGGSAKFGFSGGAIGAGGFVAAPYPMFEQDFDSVVEAFELQTDTTEQPIQDNYSDLQWLPGVRPDPYHIVIDNKEYNLENNDTIVVYTPCKVDSLKLNGNCTLLSACPQIYPKLDSYQTYFNDYFCKLEPMYAGVCCVEINNP